MSLIERDESGNPRHWTIRIGVVDGYRRVKDNEPKFHEDVMVEVVAATEVERLQAWLAYLGEASEDDTVRAAVELALKGEAPDPAGGQ